MVNAQCCATLKLMSFSGRAQSATSFQLFCLDMSSEKFSVSSTKNFGKPYRKLSFRSAAAQCTHLMQDVYSSSCLAPCYLPVRVCSPIVFTHADICVRVSPAANVDIWIHIAFNEWSCTALSIFPNVYDADLGILEFIQHSWCQFWRIFFVYIN